MKFDTTGLLPPQFGHAEFLANSLESNRLSWDGSITGAGKTYTACSIIRHLKKDFSVICPKVAIPAWKRVLNEFGLKPKLIINYEKLARGNTPYYKYVSPNKYRKLHNMDKSVDVPDFLRAELKIPKDQILILDEAHKCKGMESLQAGLLFNIARQNYQAHLMSATLATTPLDLRAFGFAAKLHDGSMKGFKQFARDSGAQDVGKWGAQYFDSENPESMEKLEKVRSLLFNQKKIASRLNRKDFGDLFPETTIVSDPCDMGVNSVKIKAVYDEMEYELDRLEEHCQNYSQHVLAIITKARRHAELLKVPTAVEMMMEYNKEGRSALIFLNYSDSINSVVKRLSDEFDPKLIAQIHGGISCKEREEGIQGFQRDEKHFMVANLAAGGQCVNLHDTIGNRGRSSIINPSYSAISVLQSAGRTDRANTKSDVYLRFLLASGTIEENVGSRFNNKNAFITALNEGTLTDADLIPNSRLFHLVHGLDI